MTTERIYNNVVDNRVLDGSLVVGDVTSVGLPDIEHPTTDIETSGMIGALSVPDMLRFKAMSYSIAHNKGINSHVLPEPRTHQHELRIARQRFNTQTGEIEYESVKYRMNGVHVKRSLGNDERGNPLGNTDDYSCLRIVEEVDGNETMVIDILAGIVRFNGVDYSDMLSSILD